MGVKALQITRGIVIDTAVIFVVAEKLSTVIGINLSIVIARLKGIVIAVKQGVFCRLTAVGDIVGIIHPHVLPAVRRFARSVHGHIALQLQQPLPRLAA